MNTYVININNVINVISIVVECSLSVQKAVSSIPSRVRPKTLIIVQTESLPSTRHFREKVWEETGV